jgi:hypothetical protein
VIALKTHHSFFIRTAAFQGYEEGRQSVIRKRSGLAK